MIKKLSLKALVIAVFFLAIGGYGYSKTKDLIIGPAIIIESPTNGATLEDQKVAVRGRADRINRLFLNGRQIFTDARGQFAEEILLAYGYNVVELRAEGKFGEQIKKTLELVLK